MSDNADIVKEFVMESLEGLDQVDTELLALESNPGDEQVLQSIFRNVHSMKGACGFLEFFVLEKVAHAGENVLDALRQGQIHLDDSLVTVLLEMNDALRRLLGTIQESGTDAGADEFSGLVDRLHSAVSELDESGSAEPEESEAQVKGTRAKETVSADDVTSHPGAASGAGERPEASKPASESPAPASVQAASEAAGKPASETSIRLRVEQLDALMNLAGELVLARNQVVQSSESHPDAAVHATAQRLSRITTELQEGIMKIRMQPISTLWGKLPRVVRGMSLQLSKEVELKMEGAETEVDKTLLEAIKDPLTHLVRNSLDHGIEEPDVRESAGKPRKATLTLSAFHESGQVNIIVRDDGRGIDPAAIRAKAVERGVLTQEEAARIDNRAVLDILFAPGFSTAEQVTAISGRGVGMDVVKRNLERVGGTVEIESELGSGTEVIVRIPLTLAIIPALTVHSGGNRYAIPQANLLELLRVSSEDALGIEEVFGHRVFRLRGDLLDLVDLNDQLGTPSTHEAQECSIAVVQASGRSFGLIVDGIYESEEIVVKPLARAVTSLHAYAGTTILADGQVALILDILGIAEAAELLSEDELERAAQGVGRDGLREGAAAAPPIEYLVTSLGDGRRVAMELSRVDRLEDIDPATVETAGRLRFVQYRDGLLQLVDVGEALGCGPAADPNKRMWKTIVYTHAGTTYGLVVADVVDILEVSGAEARRASPEPAIESVLVVGGLVTEIMDDAWLAASLGVGVAVESTSVEVDAPVEGGAIDRRPTRGDESLAQLCTFRLGGQLYGVDVLDVQEVLMPQQRTPIPLSPPEVEGLLNLRGDTVLAVDLGVLLGGGPSEPATRSIEHKLTECTQDDLCELMNVVLRTSDGTMSMLVDEVGEVMDLPRSTFKPCPSSLPPAQARVSMGVFKLEQELLIQLDVGNLYGLVAAAHLAHS